MSSQPPQSAGAQPAQPVFQVEKIYTKDASIELPNAPQIFTEAAQPQVEVQMQQESANFADGLYEVTVKATVTARAGEKTLFLVEAAQCGIFTVRNVAAQDIDPLLSVTCANIVFPYLRETISDLVTRAGFPPVLLAHVAFEALYLQRQQQGGQQPEQGRIEVAR